MNRAEPGRGVELWGAAVIGRGRIGRKVDRLLADPRDPSALGDAILRLLNDATLRDHVRANAPARAAEFSVQRMADRTMSVYESVAAATDGRS